MIQFQKFKEFGLKITVPTCIFLLTSVLHNTNIVYASTAPVTATVSPGSIAGSTQLSLNPINPGDTFLYVISNSAIGTLPDVGSTAPAGTDYTSSNDITGVDPTTNKYLDVYEISGTNDVEGFTEIILTASDITAPAFSLPPTVSPGTIASSTQLNLAPINPTDTLEYVISDTPIGTLPLTESLAPNGTSYTSGANITGIDSTTNKYLEVYEVSGANLVEAFTEITLIDGNISVPTFTTAPTAAPGTTVGSTKLTLTPINPGDTFKYVINTSPIGSLPVVDSTAPAGIVYTSGRNISGVDPITNKYLDVYEVSGANIVQAFTEIILTNSDVTVPTFRSSPAIAPGTVAGSTKLTLTPINPGDSFLYLIGTSALGSLPIAGSTSPVGISYTSGNNITGVDPTTTKYLDVYEVSGTNVIQAFIEIKLSANNITAPALVSTPTAAPGTSSGSTTLTLNANAPGNTFKVNVVSKAAALPVMGITPPGTAYTSGGNIKGVDPTANKYVDVYEIDSSGKVAAFSEITLTANVITAPSFKIAPIAAKGSAPGSTKVTLTPNNSSDTLRYVVGNSPLSTLPVIGSSAPSGTAYTSGTDIPGVDAITNKYLDIYELDSSGKITNFWEITLAGTNITAPAIAITPAAAPGTTAGSTKLNLTTSNSGNTFKINVVSKTAALPVIGSTPLGSVYTSGNNITGVDPITNKYVDVYELDSNSKVVAFSEVNLAAGNITAPSLKIAPIAAKGSAPGTTKLTITPNTKNDTFAYVVGTSALGTLPPIGSTVSSGIAYTSGSDITGIDSTTKKYLDVYELDSNGKVAAFSEIILGASNITAPDITTTPTAAPGITAGSTKLTLVTSNSGDTFKVNVVNKATTLPVVGSAPTGKAYTSGSDLTGVDPNTFKYVDVYELNSAGKVVNFSEITLAASNITAPVFRITPISAKGSGIKTTKLTIIPNTKNNTFTYVIAASPLSTLPAMGSTVSSGTAYASGSDITGVDPTTSKYLDIYELDSNGKVAVFSEITLTANNISAPAMTTTPTAAPGTAAGSTKLTLTASSLGNTFKINLVSKATVLPSIGSVPTGRVYTSGSNITGVDPITNKYIDVYELDTTGKVACFSEITLAASQIAAPTFKVTPVAAKGSAAGTTKVALTPNTKNDTFTYVISTSPLGTLPVTGSTVSSGTAYTSGTDITGIDPTTNKYLDIYELDSNGKVAYFSEIILKASNIAAPAMTTTPTASPGTAAGSTKLTVIASTSGNTFKVNVVNRPTALPTMGSIPFGKAYSSGSNITGIDPIINKYVDVYELDSTGRVVDFSEITLAANEITAPSIRTAPIISKGSAAGTTNVTLTAKTKSDTFQYIIRSSAIGTLPVQASTVSSGTAYTSGTDITGVDPTTNKFLDIYEVSGTNTIEAFTEIILTPNKITAPAMGTKPIAAPGTVAKSTKLTLTPDAGGISFKINVVSKTATPPVIGTIPIAKIYTSGSNITGVDAAIYKYIDVYELDSTGKVINFSEITLSASDIN